MGCSNFSDEAAKNNRALENAMARDKIVEQKIKKLLLLGAGESGKSTIFKQLQQIHHDTFNGEEERRPYVSILHHNTLLSIKTLIKHSKAFVEDGLKECEVKNTEAANFLEGLRSDTQLTPEIAKHVKSAWSDPGIQETYKHRSKYQLNDSAAFFFDKVDQLAAADYLPTFDDVLRARVRTTGILEQEFESGGHMFRVVDVGGQRNERKKWIHCFSDVTAVLFVAALNGYDQVLYEDSSVNRMHESINLFREICSLKWFRNTPMLLYLNKKDLFEDKVKKVDLKCCFPEYDGGLDYEKALEFIKGRFEAAHEAAKAAPAQQMTSEGGAPVPATPAAPPATTTPAVPEKSTSEVYIHVTTAINTDNVRAVFEACRDIVIREALRSAGIMA